MFLKKVKFINEYIDLILKNMTKIYYIKIPINLNPKQLKKKKINYIFIFLVAILSSWSAQYSLLQTSMRSPFGYIPFPEFVETVI